MSRVIKKINIALGVLLIATLFTIIVEWEKTYFYFGFDQVYFYGRQNRIEQPQEDYTESEDNPTTYVSDYRYNQRPGSSYFNRLPEYKAQFVSYKEVEHLPARPIEISWDMLVNIQYQLRYFRKLDMEVNAPIFSQAVKALNGREVIIKGYVLPFDMKNNALALSANPNASCFFCGKASPASVISMYLRDRRKNYKMDDYKTFRGILHLNPDNPDELYYILKNATEE